MSTRQMTKIKCDDCGAESEVPFVPTPGRKVYCKACHLKRLEKRRSEQRIVQSTSFVKEDPPRGVTVYDRKWNQLHVGGEDPNADRNR
jgi:CxxC-x17-CxxC domain-containing protein